MTAHIPKNDIDLPTEEVHRHAHLSLWEDVVVVCVYDEPSSLKGFCDVGVFHVLTLIWSTIDPLRTYDMPDKLPLIDLVLITDERTLSPSFPTKKDL